MADLMMLRRRILTQNGRLPPGYLEYDYLQTTGYNSRINTGVFGDDQTLVFDFTYMRKESADYQGAFGNYQSEATRCWRMIQSVTAYPAFYIATMGNRKASASTSLQACNSPSGTTVGHKVHFNISWGRIAVECDDGYSNTITAADDGTAAHSVNAIAIGSNSPQGAGGSVKNRFYGAFKIWSQGTLIRDYIPAVRLSDNKAGFYDLVNHTFNPSIGTAEFVAGND